MSRLILVPLALAMSVLTVASIGTAAEEQEAARLRSEEEQIKAELPALIERIETLSNQLKAVQAECQKVEEQAKRAPDNAERSSKLAALQATISRNARELQDELSKYESTLQTKTKQLAEIGRRVKQTAEKARNEFNQGPGEEVAQRIQQLRKQLAEATEAGKKEIADRLKKEIKDYAVETATEKMHQAKRNAETAFKQQLEAVEKASRQQMEAMEKRIHQLREQGQPEIAERLAAQLRRMMRSLHSAEEARKQFEAQRQQASRGVEELRQRESAKRLVPPLEALAKQRAAMQQQAAKQLDAELREHEEEMQREVAQRLEREIAQQREQGHHQLAAQLERELQSRMDKLHRVQPQEAQPGNQPHPLGPEQRRELERRVHHLRAAAENLAAIGMHDLVERLSREAEEIDKTLHSPQQPGAAPHDGIMEAIHHEFETIHHRLDELTKRVEQLTKAHPEGVRG